jgi:hypothetical protein
MPNPRRRCLIVRLEPRHEETLPSMVDAANRAGYRPVVMLSNRSKRRRGDIFAEVPGLDADVRYEGFNDDSGYDRLTALASECDFVLMNSFNRRKSIDWAMSLKVPVIILVHSIEHFLEEPQAQVALDNPRIQFLTLSQHVMSELVARVGKARMDRIDVIEPCLWSVDDPKPASGTPRRVAIPGAISLRTRDYPGLIRAVAENRKAFEGYRFVLGSGGEDREAIEAETKAKGLEPWFEYLPLSGDQVAQDVYMDSLRRSQVMLSLIPDDFEKYQTLKITSAVPTSVGFAVPLIMDRWSVACYRAPLIGADHGLRASLDRLLSLTEDELQAHRASLIAYRRERLALNGQSLARLAARVI